MIFHCDCFNFFRFNTTRYRTVFMDPPDGIGVAYDAFEDKFDSEEYELFIFKLLIRNMEIADVVWLSYNVGWFLEVASAVGEALEQPEFKDDWWVRQFIWHYTFGQNQRKDCTPSYRPIIRLARAGWEPNMKHIGVESQRSRSGDKRAAGKLKAPDDVWTFPRVVGNAHERCPWIPTQHPRALLYRILLMSGPGAVFDPFLGSGTTMRVARELGHECDGTEISELYCKRISYETGLPFTHLGSDETITEARVVREVEWEDEVRENDQHP